MTNENPTPPNLTISVEHGDGECQTTISTNATKDRAIDGQVMARLLGNIAAAALRYAGEIDTTAGADGLFLRQVLEAIGSSAAGMQDLGGGHHVQTNNELLEALKQQQEAAQPLVWLVTGPDEARERFFELAGPTVEPVERRGQTVLCLLKLEYLGEAMTHAMHADVTVQKREKDPEDSEKLVWPLVHTGTHGEFWSPDPPQQEGESDER